MKQALLFVTHIRSARILRHIERLRDETQDLLRVFVCVDDRETREDTVSPFPIDFRVSLDLFERVLPTRFEEQRPTGTPTGFMDGRIIPHMVSDKISGYTHVWVMEADVDFAGNWADFFRPTFESSADVLATATCARPDDPKWFHWRTFKAPQQISPENHVHSFFPMTRLSRNFLRAYPKEMRSGQWRGHYEAIWPTFALQRGMKVEDMGGNGRFRWNRPDLYRNTPGVPNLSPGTFVFRPPRNTYYHEDPSLFEEQGMLYHPVKTWVDPVAKT